LSEDGEWTEEGNLLISAIQKPAEMDALQLADKLQRSAPALVIHCLQQWCYDLNCAKLTGQVRYFPEQADILLNLSANISSMRLLEFYAELQTAMREAYHPLNAKLQFESVLLSYRQIFATTST
jgi:hypothetical protein